MIFISRLRLRAKMRRSPAMDVGCANWLIPGSDEGPASAPGMPPGRGYNPASPAAEDAMSTEKKPPSDFVVGTVLFIIFLVFMTVWMQVYA
jgi:hypothetical protein